MMATQNNPGSARLGNKLYVNNNASTVKSVIIFVAPKTTLQTAVS